MTRRPTAASQIGVSHPLRTGVSVLASAGLTRAVWAGARRFPPGGVVSWQRCNHRGRPVSLLAGPAVALASAATAGALGRRGHRCAGLITALGAGVIGGYDDRAGARPDQGADKGVAGHVAALRAGRISAGAAKALGLSTLGVTVAGAFVRGPGPRLVAGGVIAGAANAVNLLDVRPGRAGKLTLLAGLPLLGGPAGALAAAPVGAAAAMLPDDLGERAMLGDAGANALGALLGLRLVAGSPPSRHATVLAVLAALTAASELVSFSAVIAATPGLRALDSWGRLTPTLAR